MKSRSRTAIGGSIEKCPPIRLADSLFWVIGRTETEIQPRIQPALSRPRMLRIAAKRRGSGSGGRGMVLNTPHGQQRDQKYQQASAQ